MDTFHLQLRFSNDLHGFLVNVIFVIACISSMFENQVFLRQLCIILFCCVGIILQTRRMKYFTLISHLYKSFESTKYLARDSEFFVNAVIFEAAK